MRPLRFCMVTTFYPPFNFGGDGIFVSSLAQELAVRGHHVEVIHSVDAFRLLAPALPDAAPCRRDRFGVTVHGLHSPLGAAAVLAAHQTGRPAFYGPRIARILAGGFDVVHFHNVSLLGGPDLFRHGGGIRLHTLHDYWLFCSTHVMFRFDGTACRRPRCLACTLAHGRPPQWWRFRRGWHEALAGIDTVIAPSRFALDLCRERELPAPIVHLPHFASALPAGEDEGPRSPARPYFLFVGRLEKLKGLETLLDAFRRRPAARLVVAGSGSGERRLRAAAGGNIRFLGQVPRERLAGLFRGAVALIVPSLCFEIGPLVVLEAFAQGTPVIARNLGGTPESVRESGGGIVFDAEEELLAAIDKLGADPTFRDELGARAKETYLRKWTAAAHLDAYLGLIEELGRKAVDRR